MQACRFFWGGSFFLKVTTYHKVTGYSRGSAMTLRLKYFTGNVKISVEFLLYSSCAILGKFPCYLTFWEAHLSNFGCLLVRLHAPNFSVHLQLLAWQAPFFFTVSTSVMKISEPQGSRLEGRKEEGSTVHISNTRRRDYWIKPVHISLRQAKYSFYSRVVVQMWNSATGCHKC